MKLNSNILKYFPGNNFGKYFLYQVMHYTYYTCSGRGRNNKVISGSEAVNKKNFILSLFFGTIVMRRGDVDARTTWSWNC